MQIDALAAAASKDSAPAADVVQLVAFSVGDHTYGVEITTVVEIRAWSGATPLPNTRDFVRGVVNLRGAIVPIYDLRARFGEGRTEATGTHVVVVMSVAGRWLGLLVDAVSDILSVARSEVHTVPVTSRSDAGLLRGIVTHEGRMVGLLDMPTVVAGARTDG